MNTNQNCPDIAAIIPVYNNQISLIELTTRLIPVLKSFSCNYQILFVNDNSIDNSLSILEELSVNIPEVFYINLTKNIGQQQAIRKGLEQVVANHYVTMDADLQDPSETIIDMYKHLLEHRCDAVFARRKNQYQSSIRMLSSRLFKYLMHLMVGLPKGTGGFIIFNRKVCNAILGMNTKRFYLAGLIAKTNLNLSTTKTYRNRRIGDKSAYSLLKRIRVAISNIMCLLEGKKQ